MKDKSQVRIFISYRRKGGIDTARWLHDQLKERGYDVFLDLEGLRAGAFNTALYQKIKNSDVFLMVLTKNSLKRCSDKNDWVRQELSYALRCGLNVIPVMKDDFVFPHRLPADISPIRSYNGLQIRYEFFDAFMAKLEEYILSEADQIYIPEPEPDAFWKKYVLMGLALIVLLVGVFFLGKGSDHREETDADLSGEVSSQADTTQASEEPTQPPTQASTEEQTTQSPTETPTKQATEETSATQKEQAGNTLTNLCNGAVLAPSSDKKVIHMRSADVAWYNRLIDVGLSYYYNTAERFVAVNWKEGEQTLRVKLLKDVNCQYLYVTSQWLYCVLEEDGISTLYRAKNNMEAHSIGQLESLVTGVHADPNQIAITGDRIYYWIRTEGLYECRTDGTEPRLLFNNGGSKNLHGLITFHVSDEYLYFWASTGGIYSILLMDGTCRHVVNTKEMAGVPSHAVEMQGKFYYVMRQENDGVRIAPDSIWSVNMDGTENKLIYTMDNTDMDILNLNAVNSTLYLKIADSNSIALYNFSVTNGKMAVSFSYE